MQNRSSNRHVGLGSQGRSPSFVLLITLELPRFPLQHQSSLRSCCSIRRLQAGGHTSSPKLCKWECPAPGQLQLLLFVCLMPGSFDCALPPPRSPIHAPKLIAMASALARETTIPVVSQPDSAIPSIRQSRSVQVEALRLLSKILLKDERL